MKRHIDWPERLNDFLVENRATPFAWGTNDCCSFAARAIEAITGENPMAGLPAYRSALGAMLLTRRRLMCLDWHDRCGILRWPAALGFRVLGSPLLAWRGDIVAAQHEGGLAIGVVAGSSAAFPTRDGIGWLRVMRCMRAWEVAHG